MGVVEAEDFPPRSSQLGSPLRPRWGWGVGGGGGVEPHGLKEAHMLPSQRSPGSFSSDSMWPWKTKLCRKSSGGKWAEVFPSSVDTCTVFWSYLSLAGNLWLCKTITAFLLMSPEFWLSLLKTLPMECDNM